MVESEPVKRRNWEIVYMESIFTSVEENFALSSKLPAA